MNYLAHTLLAHGDADLEVGGILGDFVRGHLDPALPAGLRAGIRLHRAVDSFTDQHAEVLAAKRLFAPPWRRYAGILLDMWFDHCLARDFCHWSSLPLDEFSTRLRQRVATRAKWLPVDMRRFAAYMREHDLPAGYADADMFMVALAGIGQRLKRPNPLAQAWEPLHDQEAALQRHFERFFPDLVQFAEQWRRQEAAGSLDSRA